MIQRQFTNTLTLVIAAPLFAFAFAVFVPIVVLQDLTRRHPVAMLAACGALLALR